MHMHMHIYNNYNKKEAINLRGKKGKHGRVYREDREQVRDVILFEVLKETKNGYSEELYMKYLYS